MLIAIYSRKSKWTGKGESVENQLIMCKEYIEKIITDETEKEIIEYEDEGFSGKNTKRPQFQKMMQDMKERHFDFLVCYKLDRLGRNVGDLAHLMEELDRRSTAFVSIKEKFDTSTPIGKAMLYFSGVLAQMEREQIAERVRDNMVMLARSGRWLGGNTPLGFEAHKYEKGMCNGKKKVSFFLKEREEEINLVKFIFSYFLEKRSLTKVVEYLLKNDIKTRNGKDFVISGIRDILTNPVYCIADETAFQYFYDLGCQVCIDNEELDGISGLAGYAKSSSNRYKNQATGYESWIISMGKHKGVVSGKDFVKIQQILNENKVKGDNFRKVRNNVALLSGLLYCSCGHDMRPKNYPATRLNEKGERTFAYLCLYKDRTHGEKCCTPNVHGNTIDEAVCKEILSLADSNDGIIPMLQDLKKRILSESTEVITEKQLLEQEYDKKMEQIKKLIDSLKKMGVETVTAEYINKEIQQLDDECKTIKQRISEAVEADEEKYEINSGITEYEKLLSDFTTLFPTLSLVDKREFLKGIVEKVVWDGNVAHIYLKCPVLKKHRTFLRSFWDNNKQHLLKKFPLYNHRISTAAGTYDCNKFTAAYLKGYIG